MRFARSISDGITTFRIMTRGIVLFWQYEISVFRQ